MKELALLVGNPCHDRLILPGRDPIDTLGGSVSYISAIWRSLNIPFEAIGNVGEDFLYEKDLVFIANKRPGEKTTRFKSDFTFRERMETLEALCLPLAPDDIPESNFCLAVVGSIMGEVLPETLLKMAERSPLLLCEIQGLIRKNAPGGGVYPIPLSETPYWASIERMSLLKASLKESEFFNLKEVRKKTQVVITRGSEGCSFYDREKEIHIPSRKVNEVDPTGAGDSFLAGLAAALQQGLPIEKALEMGCEWGARAVESVGVPKC